MLYIFAEESGVPQRLKETAEAAAAAGTGPAGGGIQPAVEDPVRRTGSDARRSWGRRSSHGEEFARLLRLVLTQYSVGTIPATLDQVKVSETHPQRPALA